MERTRRDVMRTGAATSGALVAGSLAGCGWIPFLGGGGFTSWMPAPGEYKDSESETFGYSNPTKIAENEDNFDEDTFESLEQQEFPNTGISYDSMSFRLGTSQYAVMDGDYEESDVIDELESDGDEETQKFTEDDEYEGYKVFIPENSDGETRDNPLFAFGVNGTKVVRANAVGDFGGFTGGTPEDGNNAVDVLETVIDTKAGNGTRFADDNEDFKLLTDELGSGTIINGSVREEEVEDGNPEGGSFEGEIASGQRITVNGETSDYKAVIVYDGESDTDQGDLEDFVDETLDDRYDPNGDPSYGTGGRTGTIEFTFDTDEY